MTQQHHLSTSQVAKQVGVHPNTVRLYEVWGFLPPPPRSPSGYRLYTQAHLEQMRLARLALHGGWPGRAIRRSALDLVRQAAAGELSRALEQARGHLELVRAERARAEAAAGIVQRWAEGGNSAIPGKPLRISVAARSLDLTIDKLRNWERNGLLQAPRDPESGYRVYGTAELARLKVIRTLRLAGYSPMAILRMMRQLDQGRTHDLRQALDTPRADEDAAAAADRWLSTLAEQEKRARHIISQLKKMLQVPRSQ